MSAITLDLRTQDGVLRRLSDVLIRNPRFFLLLLLAPPLLWLGIVYVGSLLALLIQSFFSIDEFSGLVRREFTLKTYAELLQQANLDIIIRTVLMSAAVTVTAAIIAFPIAWYAATLRHVAFATHRELHAIHYTGRHVNGDYLFLQFSAAAMAHVAVFGYNAAFAVTGRASGCSRRHPRLR